jgi:hypothetical protein
MAGKSKGKGPASDKYLLSRHHIAGCRRERKIKTGREREREREQERET